jgi:hypothetical protein
MQHEVSTELSGHLQHGSALIHKALLALLMGLAALIAGWIAYLVLVAAIILWG